jgi:hypothetical protein
MMLFKQSLRINKRLIGISLSAVAGSFFIALILFQLASQFRNWSERDCQITFEWFFFMLGIVYCSFAFPAFRTKEKTMAYLMLPVSISEKFTFEILTRIIVFILFMPLMFWLVANLEGFIVHHFVPDLINYKLSFGTVLTVFTHNNTTGWAIFGYIQIVLLAFIVAFTGASYFSKAPLMKTIFTLSIIQVGFILFIYLLYKGFNMKEVSFSIERIFFIKSEAEAVIFFALSLLVVNMSLLAIAWFSLKEKEA